jgi:hypothetical protein
MSGWHKVCDECCESAGPFTVYRKTPLVVEQDEGCSWCGRPLESGSEKADGDTWNALTCVEFEALIRRLLAGYLK